jgi:hypothetical protein
MCCVSHVWLLSERERERERERLRERERERERERGGEEREREREIRSGDVCVGFKGVGFKVLALSKGNCGAGLRRCWFSV